LQLRQIIDCPVSPSGTMRALGELGWKPDILIPDKYRRVPQWKEEASKSSVRLLAFNDFDVT
jgi:hypothetical protein